MLHVFVGAGRAGPAGRLLPEPRRLEQPEHAERRAEHVRVPVERVQQPGARIFRIFSFFGYIFHNSVL